MSSLLDLFVKPVLPPYDPLVWRQQPFEARAKAVCQAWALQGYGTPLGIIVLYGLKIMLYILGWMAFCSHSPALGGPSTVVSWWLEPLAFQKAIVWSMLFELLGLGCGSGPLTGRYLPPLGGPLYWLRPGTTRLPLFPGMPVLGGLTRTGLDMAVYAGVLAALLHAQVAQSLMSQHFLPIVLMLVVAGVLDKTLFLAARGEHYWVTSLVFWASPDWMAGAMCVQLCLWFFAGVSKLNHHFPTVVCVMTSNSPVTRFEWIRRRMYQSYPDDLRPSRLATWMAHLGTMLE